MNVRTEVKRLREEIGATEVVCPDCRNGWGPGPVPRIERAKRSEAQNPTTPPCPACGPTPADYGVVIFRIIYPDGEETP